MGRTTKVITAGSDVSCSYNGMGDMTEIVRGDGMKYVLEYDAYRNLDSIRINGKSEKLIKYTYRDNNGIRTSKTVNGVKHTYILDGTRVLKETWGTNIPV